MTRKIALLTLPIVIILACSDDNSSSSPTEPQSPTSFETVGNSSSSEEVGSTVKSSDSKSALASSSSDEFITAPATLPDSVREEIEREIRQERLNNQISKIKSAKECNSIDGITEEEISYCKTRFCILHPEIWQGCEDDVVTSSNSVEMVSSSSVSTVLASPCKDKKADNCEYDSLTDSRDGKIYKTVKIGNQWWMAENLNYDMEDSFCYNDSIEYCAKWGRFYTWNSAQNACPEHWHLPSMQEWNGLFTAVGGESKAGAALKTREGWFEGGNGSDAYGFSAIPVEIYNSASGKYSNEDGHRAFFWSSTEDTSVNSYYVYLFYLNDDFFEESYRKTIARSVRCLKD